jgi:hypothetical protein
MAFEDLFKVYANKNMELRAIAKAAFEFGATIAMEPSANMSIAIDEHAMARQRSYISSLTGQLEAFHQRPVPDMPYLHPTRFDIDLSEQYKQFTKDGLPINEDTQLLAQYWMACAVELAASQSAGLAGSIIDADYNRVITHLGVISQYLDELERRPAVDLPETAFPGAALEVPSSSSQ